MKEITISNGIFKHNNKELEFIGLFIESRGYQVYYKDGTNIEFLDNGEEIIDPKYINPLRALLEKSNGFIAPVEEIENPFKFYNILTSGNIPEELEAINKMAHYIGLKIAPLLDIKVFSDEWSYKDPMLDSKGNPILLNNGEPYREAYREQLVTDEALTDLGLTFLARIVGTLKTNKIRNTDIIEELDQLELETITPILEELKLEELEELKASLVNRWN